LALKILVLIAGFWLLTPWSARAQTVVAEALMHAGYSTQQDAAAGGGQARLFGDVLSAVRFYLEAAWGATSDRDVDAFGSAYPYGNRLQAIEAYGEWMIQTGSRLIAVKAGRYRPPFGISSGSDHAYGGFLRAPLMRYDGYFALSNNFLEHGIDIIAGTPRLTVEASIGTPADVGSSRRRPHLDGVIRFQHYAGPLIVGVSYIDTSPYQPRRFAHGRTRFGGVDARWMRGGVQLRGEVLWGQPFEGTTTTGWYADVFLHRPGMGPLTAVGRVERLAYEATPPFDLYAGRQTIGARIRLIQSLSLQLNLLHQTEALAPRGSVISEIGISYSVRRD
jgi:hypothetical protein